MNVKYSGLVSIVIPTYNRSRDCRQAVLSVLSQTYSDVEVLVVDDGSTDDTAEVLAQIGDARVRCIRQENAGVSAARNTGFAHARGEYVALLDSDDTWVEWKLEVQLKVLARYPGAGMVWSDMAAVDEKGADLHDSYLTLMYDAYRFFQRDVHFRESVELGNLWDGCPEAWRGRKCYVGDIFPWMFMGNLVHTSTVLLRRKRREAVGGFDIGLKKSGEDYDFHFRTCREGEVAYIDIPSVRYRIGGEDQLTAARYNIFMARNDLTTITRMWNQSKDRITISEALIRRRFAASHEWVGLAEFPGNLPEARSHLGASLRYRPLQPKVLAYLFLSTLPEGVIETLRRMKNAVGSR